MLITSWGSLYHLCDSFSIIKLSKYLECLNFELTISYNRQRLRVLCTFSVKVYFRNFMVALNQNLSKNLRSNPKTKSWFRLQPVPVKRNHVTFSINLIFPSLKMKKSLKNQKLGKVATFAVTTCITDKTPYLWEDIWWLMKMPHLFASFVKRHSK